MLILSFVVLVLMVPQVLAQAEMFVHQQASAKKPSKLASIPEAKEAELNAIRNAKDWTNPYVIVNALDFELRLGREERIRKTKLSELEEAILNLPIERWPLGLVVAVQETGLRDPGENEVIDQRFEEVQKMLEGHGIKVQLRPSG